jgi:hypothetical protein
MIHYKNIGKGILSTIVGLILIVSAVTSLFLTSATWVQVTPVISLGLLLLGINENDFVSKDKTTNNTKDEQ